MRAPRPALLFASSLLALPLALGGCRSSPLENGGDLGGSDGAADLGPRDLAAVDLTSAPGDGFVTCNPTGTAKQQFVADAITLPQQRADFAIDLNGDGKPDNQLGNIVGAITAQGLDSQGFVDQALLSGSEVLLVQESSSDPTFQNDPCAGSLVAKGKPQPPATGVQTYSIDTTAMPGLFPGTLAGALFRSFPQSPDVEMTLYLPLFSSTLVPLHLHGAHLVYATANGALGKGQLNGAIRKEDVRSQLVPALAAALDAQVQANPTSSSSQQILSLFDNGGTNGSCTNLDGSTGKAKDGRISDCEVAENSIIRNVLAPDVQLFQNGVYAPSPANTAKDSLSVGIGFTGRPAQF